jgi:virulence-associated protein VagC
MSMEESQKLSQLAFDREWQKRVHIVMTGHAGTITPANQQANQWLVNNGPGTISGAFEIITVDPSVKNAVIAVPDPWDTIKANNAVTEGALLAAVAEQWPKILAAFGISQPA